MKQNQRTMLAVFITLLVAFAVFISFGQNYLTLKVPEVIFPAASGSLGQSSSTSEAEGNLNWAEITPNSVQSVISALARDKSYYHAVTTELISADKKTSTNSVLWHHDNWTRVIHTLEDGLIRHELIGPETHYFWYQNDRTYLTVPADNKSSDLAQRIPTYQDVLSLSKENIIAASYQVWEGYPCIYLETTDPMLGYTLRFWVDTKSGVLLCAESMIDDAVFYRMSTIELKSPYEGEFTYLLPDNTLAPH